MRKEQEIFTQVDAQNVPVSADILDTLEQEVMNESVFREYIREMISESYFPLEGGDKMRVHHTREGSRSGGEPQISGFSQKVGHKPNGLWYECQDGSSETWEQFCDTGFGDDKYYEKKYDGTYNVILNDYTILFIPDEHHFDKFMKMYGVPHPTFPNDPEESRPDWAKVASHYDGIEICPYIESRRNMTWYYGWDVASGCVWNASGIKELIKAGDCKDESAA